MTPKSSVAMQEMSQGKGQSGVVRCSVCYESFQDIPEDTVGAAGRGDWHFTLGCLILNRGSAHLPWCCHCSRIQSGEDVLIQLDICPQKCAGGGRKHISEDGRLDGAVCTSKPKRATEIIHLGRREWGVPLTLLPTHSMGPQKQNITDSRGFMRENTEIRAKKQRLLVKCIHVLPTLGLNWWNRKEISCPFLK